MITKEEIKAYLKGKNQYDRTDDVLIDELIFNLVLMQECKKNFIREDAWKILIDVSSNPDKPSLQLNHAIGAYNNALANVLRIANKLIINPNDRAKLKLNKASEIGDGFNE